MSTKIERNEQIKVLEKEFDGATGIYMTDFSKITVQDITTFRSNLREAGSKYIVVKNSLAGIALKKNGKEELCSFLKGPIGLAITKNDNIGPAKVIRDFQKNNKGLMDVKASYIDNTVFSSEDTLKLADLPNKEILLSQLLSCLKAPLSNFVGSLNGIFTKLTGTLEAVKNRKESEG
jgi:large subunit ribosomal protein L10